MAALQFVALSTSNAPNSHTHTALPLLWTPNAVCRCPTCADTPALHPLLSLRVPPNRSNRVFVANVGDSRAVGCIGGKTIALSQDHKPNLPQEKARVIAAGGTVTSMMGCHRVMGMLAMSRALGDVMIEQYLSQEPDVTEQQLGEHDFIIMASDGLWDVITSQEAVSIVSQEGNKSGWSSDNLTAIAHRLCIESFRRGSMDNITVMIVAGIAQDPGETPTPKNAKTLGGGRQSLGRIPPNGPNGSSSVGVSGGYAGDSPSNQKNGGGYEPAPPSMRMPFAAARSENSREIAETLWGGGPMGGRGVGPGKGRDALMGPGGGMNKTLLPTG